MMLRCFKIALTLLLIFNPDLHSQKNIVDYFQMAFPNGKTFESEAPVQLVDTENSYLEYFIYDDSQKKTLLQAKIYPVKKGNDLLLIVYDSQDMQCAWNTQLAYEIDEKNDSLIKINFESKLRYNGFGGFADTKAIETTIFPKYQDSLSDYLGKENSFSQFLEEIYDLKIELNQYDLSLKSSLMTCDYIPRNLLEISESDWAFISATKTIIFDFNKKKKAFAEKKK